METNITRFKKELDELIKEGDLLYISLLTEIMEKIEKTKEPDKEIDLPIFKDEYERWYSVSMQIIKQILPDRLTDFLILYKDDKRKDISALNYGVSDYLIGIEARRYGEIVVDAKSAVPKFEQQLNILKSARARLESSLFDMLEVLQADIFDDELEAATELAKKGFLRGAGAITGVVLEKHLYHVCGKHALKTRKKAPTINDLNQMLKDNNVIDTPMWRFIQHLGDIRNLCDHNKDREPSKDDLNDLISGVTKVIKTLF